MLCRNQPSGFLKPHRSSRPAPLRAIWPLVRLAEIINSRPEKLAGNVAVCFHREPCVVLMAVFAAVNDPLRKFFMVGGVTRFLVIVTDGVEQFRQVDGVRHFDVRQRRRDGARAVQRFHGGNQRRGAGQQVRGRWIFGMIIIAQRRIRKRIIGIIHFVADAPENDARMIAVAADQIRNVRHRPLVENFAVAEMVRHAVVPAGHPFVFSRREFVKRLVHHHEAEPVAEVQTAPGPADCGWCGWH